MIRYKDILLIAAAGVSAAVALAAAPIWIVDDRPIQSSSTSQIPKNPNEPALTWSTNPLEVILSPGDVASRTLTLTGSRSIGGVRLRVTGPISKSLRVCVLEEDERGLTRAPCVDRPFNIKEGQAKRIRFGFTIPADVDPKNQTGSVEVWHGQALIANSLKVNLTTWNAAADNELSVLIRYPDSLNLVRQQGLPNHLILRSTATELALGGATPEDGLPYSTTGFQITFYETPAAALFDVGAWLKLHFPNSEVSRMSPFEIDALHGFEITFANEVGAGEPLVVIPRADSVFVARYASSFREGSEEEKQGLSILYAVLHNLRFR